MFFGRKSAGLSLESLDLRLREIENRLALRDTPLTSRDSPKVYITGETRAGYVEAALASYERAWRADQAKRG